MIMMIFVTFAHMILLWCICVLFKLRLSWFPFKILLWCNYLFKASMARPKKNK